MINLAENGSKFSVKRIGKGLAVGGLVVAGVLLAKAGLSGGGTCEEDFDSYDIEEDSYESEDSNEDEVK